MQVQETAVQTNAVLTVPNVLSALRLLGVPVFLWLILGPEADGWAVLLLMVAGFTDWLDGKLARRWNQISRLGQLLDPLADRLYILATLIGLADPRHRPVAGSWRLLVARDLVLLCLVPTLRRQGYDPLPVHFLGKAATFNLLYAFPLLLLGDGDWCPGDGRVRLRLGLRDLGDRAVLVGRLCCTSSRSARSTRRRDLPWQVTA